MKGFVPDFILKNNKENAAGGKFNGFVLFADISGFTKMTEEMMKEGRSGAEKTSKILNFCFKEMTEIVHDNKGFVATFAGDALTAVFMDESPSSCLSAATGIRGFFNEHSLKGKNSFGFDVSVKVGIAYGNVEWGIIGENPKNYYFMSKAVENAAEAEKHLGKQEVGIHKSTSQAILKGIDYQERGDVFLVNENKPAKRTNSSSKHNYTGEEEFLHGDLVKNVENEFRSVATVFLSLKEMSRRKDIESVYEKIKKLADTYKGYIPLIDFGDKGAKIMVLFGAPRSRENDLKMAAKFVLEASAKLKNNAKCGFTYATCYAGRIGGNYRATYTVIGKSVNLAARLMTHAKWGDVLTDGETGKKLKNQFFLKDCGEETFKGFSGKTKVMLISGERESSAGLFDGEMVGRTDELTSLEKFIKSKGNRIMEARVTGEAGIGKSRLLSEALKNLANESLILYAECDELLRESLNPIKQMMRGYFLNSSDETGRNEKELFEERFSKLLKKVLDESSRNELERVKSILGGLAGIETKNSLYSRLSGSSLFQNILIALRLMLETESSKNRIILAIEDFHNADRETIMALKKIAQDKRLNGIAIVTTERPSDGQAPEMLVKEESRFMILNVKILNNEEIKSLSRRILGGMPDAGLLRMISDKSEGNPFLSGADMPLPS
ncbi:MAG: adenylate/guanylate cyclase domain-containing protein [bacterium]|nr:adenylate/guanylate cyclase domain-containing protein [bacterium]